MVTDSYASIRAEITRIAKAHAARDYWAVLKIPSGSGYQQIKAAQRKWVRRLHPDRWFASADSHLYNEIQEAFYQVQVAYFEALKRRASADREATQQAPITMPSAMANDTAERGRFGWFQRLLKKLPPFSFARRSSS